LSHYLPAKITSYLVRLKSEYAIQGRTLDLDIITHCRVRVIEETGYDDIDGGYHGHDVRLYLPLEVLLRVGLSRQEKVQQRICDDLNLLARQVQGEYFRAVQFELNDENDPDFQSALSFSPKLPTNPEALPFWKPGMVRLFISHRDQHKAEANRLAGELEAYGISSFVAHDTIRPMSEWRKEIMKGLETMEIMLIYLTDDFEDSTWTNQEVGYALGADKPIVSLKVGRKDPPGFIGHEQALRGQVDTPDKSAQALYPLLAQALGRQERLDDSLIEAFASSTNFNDTISRFNLMEKTISNLSQKQLAAIADAFQRNPNLSGSIYLTNHNRRLQRYLERSTGKVFSIEGRTIREKTPPAMSDDIPF
jgi:hypothetical protein